MSTFYVLGPIGVSYMYRKLFFCAAFKKYIELSMYTILCRGFKRAKQNLKEQPFGFAPALFNSIAF